MGAIFRIAAGTAKVNGNWLNPVQTDFTIGTELTASAMNYIFLKTDGTYSVTTNRTTGPANSLLLYEVFTNATIVVGYNFPTRVFASNAFNSAEVEVVVDAAGYGHTTDPLQALSYLPSTGGKIRIRPGTYTFTSQWTINKKINLEFEPGANFVMTSDLGYSANFSSGYFINLIAGSEGSILNNIKLTGNDTLFYGTYYIFGIRLNPKVTLINPDIRDFRGQGIIMCLGSLIQNGFIKQSVIGGFSVTLDTTGTVTDGYTIIGTTIETGGLSLFNSVGASVQLTNITGVSLACSGAKAQITGCAFSGDITLSNLTNSNISNCYNGGTMTLQAAVTQVLDNISVTGNVVVGALNIYNSSGGTRGPIMLTGNKAASFSVEPLVNQKEAGNSWN